jgi:hypothetical protein
MTTIHSVFDIWSYPALVASMAYRPHPMWGCVDTLTSHFLSQNVKGLSFGMGLCATAHGSYLCGQYPRTLADWEPNYSLRSFEAVE